MGCHKVVRSGVGPSSRLLVSDSALTCGLGLSLLCTFRGAASIAVVLKPYASETSLQRVWSVTLDGGKCQTC